MGGSGRKMKILDAEPPNIDEIDAAFHVRGKAVIYAYGDCVYAPGGRGVSPSLQAHERIHCERQLVHPGGVIGWWRAYIADPKFRLDEEILAHRAEFKWWKKQPNTDRPVDGFRSARLYHLTHIASRLASSLYGNIIGAAEAKRLIEGP